MCRGVITERPGKRKLLRYQGGRGIEHEGLSGLRMEEGRSWKDLKGVRMIVASGEVECGGMSVLFVLVMRGEIRLICVLACWMKREYPRYGGAFQDFKWMLRVEMRRQSRDGYSKHGRDPCIV